MSDDDLQQMYNAGRAAFDAGQNRRAAELWRVALRAAGANAKWRVCLLSWEGHALRLVGDISAALPLLLEAITIDAPDVDLADTYGARVGLVIIAVKYKTAGSARRLLAENRIWLQRAGREKWAHMLDAVEAELEGASGDWSAALCAELRGWETYIAQHPYFKRSEHLWGLCKSAYHMRDADTVSRWADELRASCAEGETDNILISWSALLAAQALAGGGRLGSGAIEEARSALRRAAGIDSNMALIGRVRCARALALGGCFTEADSAIAVRLPSHLNDRYLFALCRGDLSLQRARAALGQAPLDDEWYDDPPLPPPTGGAPDEALAHLDAAECAYASADADAHTEDERLETTYYTRRLTQRRERIARLRNAAMNRTE